MLWMDNGLSSGRASQVASISQSVAAETSSVRGARIQQVLTGAC